MYNAFTIDVEDYYQVQAFARVTSKSTWDTYPSRVANNTRVLLDLLDAHSVKATFFVLGWVAKRHPELVREIAARGHEIASHGMSHVLVYTQSKQVFREETQCSKALLEDLCQQQVIGYRAATYSITRASLWALDIIYEAGFKYDSSIVPIRHDNYGIPEAYPFPSRLRTPEGFDLIEFPVSVFSYKKLKVPVAGGGYFRLFPYGLTKSALQNINNAGHEFLFYLHPWEIDPEQPRIKNAGLLSKFRHYINLHKTEPRLRKLLTDFSFTTMRNVLSDKGLL